MAREENEREDLLREATAYSQRAEIDIPGRQLPVFIGLRSDGGLSLYFGSDPVYHFNSRGELRRAFCDGLLVKAERGRLVTLERRRTPGEVHLLRHELNHEQERGLLAKAQADLEQLRAALQENCYQLRGQVPEVVDVIGHAMAVMAGLGAVCAASSPRAQ